MSSIAQKWANLNEELKGFNVTVVAVTKYQPVYRIQEAIACGITHFGNNYVQDGAALRSQLSDSPSPDLRWHFIGHLQSRKVRSLVDYHCIQSIDRLELATELAKRTAGSPQVPKVLIEVNIGEEPTKSGVLPGALEEFVKKLDSVVGLQTDGLMAMPPPIEPVEERARYFDQMKVFFDKLAPSRGWTTLSMGTSEDYIVAVRCGATMIRLGTVLLGSRPV